MIELQNLISELRQHLKDKEHEIMQRVETNSYILSMLENRKKDVDNFELACSEAKDNLTMKYTIIANFKDGAEKLKSQIDEI